MNEVQNETVITTPSDTQIRIERELDGPREAVWEAYTNPELIVQWLGPRKFTTTVETMDVRVGGTYRYISRDADGTEYAFGGEYREVSAPEILECTFVFDGIPGGAVDRLELHELDGGRTRLVVVSTFATKEERDGMLASGMDSGVREGYERLDELLAR
jgi:uncharacterized protein YndB with AHSA1/START domain